MKNIFTYIAALMLSQIAYSQDQTCDDYPAFPGGDFDIVEGADVPRVVATAEAFPFSSDREDTADALREARIEANAIITRFIENAISSDENIDQAVQNITKKSGDSSERSQTRIKNILTAAASNSAAVLRGVVPLGDCVTPGEVVMVTVGLKPETLAAAEALNTGISQSLRRSPTTRPSNSRENNGSQDSNIDENTSDTSAFQPIESRGRSNSRRLDDF